MCKEGELEGRLNEQRLQIKDLRQRVERLEEILLALTPEPRIGRLDQLTAQV